MKTFSLILYLLFSDGSQQSFVEDYDMSAADCAAGLTEARPAPSTPFKGAREIRSVIVACELDEGRI